MGARVLLLTADEKVNALLREAIPAETCKLERCKEIFSAVEAITRDRFDLLLIDWQEALEADFLLKTARDLKSTQGLFALGLVTPSQGREALESGADAILVKPFTAAQAAEMLLPKLGIETLPAASHSLVEVENAASNSASVAPAPEATPENAKRVQPEPRKPVQRSSSGKHFALQPSPPVPSRRSRMLSLTAVVWPLIIVAALLMFDQWPVRSHHSDSRLSALVQRARGRMGKLPDSWNRSSEAASRNQLPPDGLAIPLTGDLLADYALPVQSTPDALPGNVSLNQADSIDLASVETLPSSSRLIPPVFSIEASRPEHQIPASLRFPPPAQNAHAVTPSGQLVAPGWSEAPVALPETVSRTLLEHQVAPQYPDQALKMDVDGPVVLAASIGRDGAVRDLKLVSGYLVLAHAAVDAVKQWRYKPYRRNGENVEIETLITVDFKRPPRG
jgi:TonB family protein